MDKVIGLGKLGCAIGEELTAYPEYRIYKIGTHLEERASLSLGDCGDMQAYEEEIDGDEISLYLRSIKEGDECLLILEGGDPVAGAVLRILESIQEATISVLYVAPDRLVATETQKRDDKIAFNILQEYARSGVLETIYLVSKPSVEILAGDASIQQYEKNISYFVSYVVAMINYFNHTDAVVSTKSQIKNYCRVATYGVSSLEPSAAVNLLFPLSDITDVVFYYGIPEEGVKNDNSLMKKIKEQVKNYKAKEKMSATFAVFPTTLESPIVLCVAYTDKIQTFAFSQ